MGKIRLIDNTELEIISDGIVESGDCLTLYLKDDKTVTEYDSIFSNEENTQKISVIEYTGQVFKIYPGFTQLRECGKIYDVVVDNTAEESPVMGDAVKVVMYRPSDLEKRVTALENKVGTDAIQAVMLISQMNAQVLNDEEALKVKAIYPTWRELVDKKFTAEKTDYKFTHNGDLYKTIKENQQFLENWVPGESTESIFVRIDETHSGTLEDPIPYNGNMTLEKDKYYIQDGVTYLCWNPSGIPVYDRLENLTTFVRKV